MKALNIIGAFLVLACNLAISYNHSIELFQAGGFHGWMAHVAVIGAETTFILGALNIVFSRLKGVSPGVLATLGGLLGVALVSWSNVSAGWEYGITGILLGLATPASLIVSEAILSRAILQRSAQQVEKAEGCREEVELTIFPEEEPIQQVEILEEEPPIELESTPNELEEPAQETPGTPFDWALHLYEQEKEPPSRRQLAEVAGCTEWVARQALAELKRQIS